MFLLETRLVVVRVDLGEPAIQQDEDHAAGPGWEVSPSGRGRATGQHAGEGQSAEAHEPAPGRKQARELPGWSRELSRGGLSACPAMTTGVHSR